MLTLSTARFMALHAAFPQPTKTRICLVGASTSGPVGIVRSFASRADALAAITPQYRERVTLTHGMTSLGPLTFAPRESVTFTNLTGVSPIQVPGVVVDARTLRLKRPDVQSLPFAQATQDALVQYQVPKSPVWLTDQLAALTVSEPVSVLRVNGSHASATLENTSPLGASRTGKLALFAKDAGAFGNHLTVSTYLVGTTSARQYIIELAGPDFSSIVTIPYVADGYGLLTLSQIADMINAKAALGDLPVVAWPLEDGEYSIQPTVVSFSGGDELPWSSGALALQDWVDAVHAVLVDTTTDVATPLVDLTGFDVVHVPVLV